MKIRDANRRIELAVNGLALVALVKQVFFGKEKKERKDDKQPPK